MTDAMPEMSAVERYARSILHGRYEEAFPKLTAAEIARLRPFGAERRFADGEALAETGKPSPGMFVVLAGRILVTARDGLGRVTPVVEYGPGQFSAEITSLANDAPAITDIHAQSDVEAIQIPPDNLRAVLIAEAELGERIMHALVLRRKALIEGGDAGPLIIGPATSADVVRLQHFLARNAHPHHVLDPSDPVAAKLSESFAPAESGLPLVVCPNGTHLRNPSEEALARELGLIGDVARRSLYDVAILGCGPAGLSAAVYAASEGLSVVLIDARGIGGQAGESSRIENYLGFPSGISGRALMGRAYAQARKFAVDVMMPVEVKALDCSRTDGAFAVMLEGERRVRARAVVIATGACYRRPAIENLAAFEGRGVWYWASPVEAKLCAGQEVIVVGGGNSAGQAAVFLAGRAAKVTVMVRSDGLAASMSEYLINRLAAIPNIEVATRTEIVALEGTREKGLERARWRSRGALERTSEIRHVFIFTGADPATAWLAGCDVARDRHGFVMTGAGASPLESSVPGIFAVGDVRAGSIKRLGSAIGEGGQVVSALHEFLEREETGAAGALTGAAH